MLENIDIANTLVESGILGTLVLIYIKSSEKLQTKMFKQIVKSQNIVNEKIVSGISDISRNIGKTLLTPAQTLFIVKTAINYHIRRKIIFVEQILKENDILNRKTEIKKKIKAFFMQVTQEESGKLSSFNTGVGDVGSDFLKFIDFNKFFDDTYAIVFRETKHESKEKCIASKCDDLNTLMSGMLNYYIIHLEEKLRKNSI